MNDKLAHLAGGPLFERNQEATIYVGNLDQKVNEDIVWELFLQCGPIVNVHIPRDKITNEHQGYGFVEFKSEEDADYSIKILHMVKLYGKPIKVNKASQDKRTQEVGANVFVGNLHEDVDEKMLRDVFSSFGIVLSTKVMRDPETGQSKRYGFVSYDNFESSDAALQAMNGQYLCGKPIDVSYAYKKDAQGGEKHGSVPERVLAYNKPNVGQGGGQPQQNTKNFNDTDYKQATMQAGQISQQNQPPFQPPPPQMHQNNMPMPPQLVNPMMTGGYHPQMPMPPMMAYGMPPMHQQMPAQMPPPPGYMPPPPAGYPPRMQVPPSMPPPPGDENGQENSDQAQQIFENEDNKEEQLNNSAKVNQSQDLNKDPKKESLSQSQVIEHAPDSLDKLTPKGSQDSTHTKSKDCGSKSVEESQQNSQSENLEFSMKQGQKAMKIKQKNDGSLLSLFQSEYFNIHMLFRYLYKASQDGVIEYLVHKLYEEPVQQIDYYLPQLCYMVITKDDGNTHSIEKFILETSVKYCNIGIKALQYFQSYSEDHGSQYNERAMDFYNLLESTLVNGDIPLKYLKNKNVKQKKDEEYKDKKFKADYLALQIKFVDDLKYLSLNLKKYQLSDRMPILLKKLTELNVFIEEKVRSQVQDIQTSCKYKYHGLVLPFQEGDDDEPCLVMNILPELTQPFDTKKRAPFKIVLESVKLNEIMQFRDSTQITPSRSREMIQNRMIVQELKTAKNSEERPSETLAQITNMGITQEDEEPNENPFALQEETRGDLQISTQFKPEVMNQKDSEISFKGFEQFAKFVEFEEKCFEQPKIPIQNGLNFDFDQGKLKTAQSMIFTQEDILLKSVEKQHSNHSSPREHDQKLKRQQSNKKQQDQLIESIEYKNVDHVIQEFQRKSSLHNEEKKEKTPQRDIFYEDENFDDWENISKSEMDLEGMDDPFKESWKQIERKKLALSDYKEYRSFRLRPIIVKANDDLRQEVLAMQLMKRMQYIFNEAKINIYLRPYEIFITSATSGMVEFVPDTTSIDALKKKFPKKVGPKAWNLRTFFDKYFVNNFEEAQKNFVESLAGYSLFNYIFNVKDRHNGNILLDSRGRIIHIDFGFMFQNAPGGINFEGAPFKLTQEYIDIMDGLQSEIFLYFKSLLIKGLQEIRKHLDDILILIEILMKDSRMPCFVKPANLFQEIRDRISLRFNTGDTQEKDFFELVDKLLKQSANNWRTKQYDSFQKMTNGIEV